MKRTLILVAILLITGLVNTSAQQLRRVALHKKKIELKSPSTWSKNFVKIDPQTKKEIYHDPKPRLEVADAKAGKYYMKWIGYDGKEKMTVYQRPDCVDVIVISLAIKSASGYEYEYTVQNLKTSGDYLNGFAVQNFSADVSPKRPSTANDVFIGNMSAGAFGEGNWIRFAPIPPHPKVQPGQTVKFKLYSPSPPGLVECRVNGGDFVMKGAGEELPPELETLILNYDALPRGYTIGPVDGLRKSSHEENVSYLLKALPQCQKQGWLTMQVLQTYEQLLKQNNMASIFTRIGNDLKNGSISTEVFAIVEAMKK
ncbi:MAG: hypothetical protein SF097_01405 [Acidobacteriota bacterium]|nr:hypothetical protein [Acidobacteriota bacterium]